MAIYLVQHGKAVDKDIDPDRPLSSEGNVEIEKIAIYLCNTGLRVKKIYHSGKTRAQQTAQILSGHIGDGSIEERPGMNPNDAVPEFAKTIDGNGACYVGHLPHMARLCAYLTCQNDEKAVIAFTNGGVVCLEEENNGWQIKWYLTPAMCV